MTDQIPTSKLGYSLGRRRFLALSGGGIAAAVLAACSKDDNGTATTQAPGTTGGTDTSAAPVTTTGGVTGGGGGDGTIKIGYVSPKTGALAAFGAADNYVVTGINEFVKDGLMVGGKSYTVEILVEDSESNPDTAAAKAAKLIDEDAVDLILVSSTPETTNPVSDTAEASGVPCISTVAPWQPWLIGRGGAPGADAAFDWTYHFFWGLEDVIGTFLAMWGQVDTNKAVGGLFPNDGDGNAWGDAELGFPAPLKEAGYTLVDPGRYENLNQDFTAQINAFKDAGSEIITGVVIPPDFPTFWKQAKQQGFVPKVASIGKALLFPESIQALGSDGEGLTSEVWWSPSHPYSSSLVGLTAKEVTDAYTADTGSQWTQPLGFAHALFEVAFAALAAAGSADKTAVRDAIKTLSVDTIVGTVTWGADSPSPNVAKTKLVGGQWRSADTPTGYDLVIVDNSGNPDVPAGGTVEPIAS
ncbi:MAG: ABC transporter substrate-binding protein [Actinomycetota bacterium]|nr:ABC transporter substrate-binding protein [Actinomycetota bacterium]